MNVLYSCRTCALTMSRRHSASSGRCVPSMTSSLAVARNEIYGLAGESSCGKST